MAGNDHEVLADEAEDEFSPYFSGKKTPKIMITTRISPDGKLFRMLAEFMAIIPNCFYYKRGGCSTAQHGGKREREIERETRGPCLPVCLCLR